MNTSPSFMQTIQQAITGNGYSLAAITLKGTLQHVNAGKRPGFTGRVSDRLMPVLTRLQFMHPSQTDPVLEFTNSCRRMDDPEAYWRELKTPEPVDTEQAKALMIGFVEEHRILTGEVHETHPFLEIDPARILERESKETILSLNMASLIGYLDLDEQCFLQNFSSENMEAMDALLFGRFEFTHVYKQAPCSKALYLSLLQERKSTNGAVQMSDYYVWFRESEKLFDSTGSLTGKASEGWRQAIKEWVKTERTPSSEWIQSKQSQACRILRAHPRHNHLIGALTASSINDEVRALQKAELVLAATKCLVDKGWTSHNGTALAQKAYQTAVGTKFAHAYLQDYGVDTASYLLVGNYQSEGRNQLESHGVLLPKTADAEELTQLVAQFASQADAAVAQTYAYQLGLSSSPDASEPEVPIAM